MPSPTIQYFTPSAGVNTSASFSNGVTALPDPTANLLRITNMGANSITFKLGADNTVTTTQSTGTALMGGTSLIVGAQGMAYIALFCCGGPSSSSVVNLSSGN